MKNTDKITLTVGQLKKLVTESVYHREASCIERKYKTTLKDLIEWYFQGEKFENLTEDDIENADIASFIISGGQLFDKSWRYGKYMKNQDLFYQFLIDNKDKELLAIQKFIPEDGDYPIIFSIDGVKISLSSPTGWFDD